MLGVLFLRKNLSFTGNVKRFKFPIRTTAEGTSNEYADLKGKDLDSPLLSTEEADGATLARPIVVA